MQMNDTMPAPFGIDTFMSMIKFIFPCMWGLQFWGIFNCIQTVFKQSANDLAVLNKITSKISCPGSFKIKKMAKIRNQYNQVPHQTHTTIWDNNKKTRNIIYQKAKRSAFSQQVTTRLQGTGKTVWQKQTRNTNYKNDPQKKHSLGMVGKKIYWKA